MQFLNALFVPAVVGSALALVLVIYGPATAAFGVLLNAFVLSQVAGSAQVISFELPGPYYGLRRVERDGRIYVYAGVLLFKRLMTSRPYRAFNPAFDARCWRRRPEELVVRMRDAEAAHAVAFGVMLAFSATALALGSPTAGWWILLFNVVGNAYPVMLQRYNRGRVERVIKSRRWSRL